MALLRQVLRVTRVRLRGNKSLSTVFVVSNGVERPCQNLTGPSSSKSPHSPLVDLMHSRRLDDRIRELCALAVSEERPAELKQIQEELRAAIHEYVECLRERAAAALESVPDSTTDRQNKTA